MRDLETALRAHKAGYDVAVAKGDLGKAICHREDLGKLVMAEMALVLAGLRALQMPLSEGAMPDDDHDDRVPF